jgi:hypothetical protein
MFMGMDNDLSSNLATAAVLGAELTCSPAFGAFFHMLKERQQLASFMLKALKANLFPLKIL